MKKKIINLDWVIESVRDLKWTNEEQILLDCHVKFDKLYEEVPFTIDPNDIYQHSLDLWEKANAGEYGPIQEFVATPKNEFEQLMENYKNQFDGEFSLDKI
jgi:hypothetical protein